MIARWPEMTGWPLLQMAHGSRSGLGRGERKGIDRTLVWSAVLSASATLTKRCAMAFNWHSTTFWFHPTLNSTVPRPSTAVIWVKCFRETGRCGAKPRGGSTSPLEKHADFLLALIELEPDLTLDEVVGVMRELTIPGSRTAVWRFFQRHNITFKKSLRAAEQERADVARARRRWMREQGLFDPARLVFIDETSANTKMVRLYGRCVRGERLVDLEPQGHWKTITFVAALRQNGMTAPCTIDGAMNGKRFVAYVERCLAPTLKRNDIVMIDNLPAHKAAGVREAVEARGATLRYLVSLRNALKALWHRV
jgi:transposase